MLALDVPSKGYIFSRVVKTVGKAAEVVEDIAHQIIDRVCCVMESAHLCV